MLSKLADTAFILGADYKYILEERKSREENRKEKVKKGDRHALILEALDFVDEVANKFEKFNFHDEIVIPSIRSWDELGNVVLDFINGWINYYTDKYLPDDRKKEVEEFIYKNELWIKEHVAEV